LFHVLWYYCIYFKLIPYIPLFVIMWFFVTMTKALMWHVYFVNLCLMTNSVSSGHVNGFDEYIINEWKKKVLSTIFWSCHHHLIASTLLTWGAGITTTLQMVKVALLHNPNQHLFASHAMGKVDHRRPVISEPSVWSQRLTRWYWDRDFPGLPQLSMLTI
jgi:hypothetical protein